MGRLMGEIWRRLRFRLGGARFEDDLAEEMRLHVELRAAEKRAAGMSEGEARASAQRAFGNATLERERSREAWGWRWLDSLGQDVRYGLRALRANPGFAAAAVLSLALGIGANTAIFSIVNAVMLRTLPVEDPRKLVQIQQGEVRYLTNPIWEQVRDHQTAFSGTLAFSESRFDLADGGESHFAQGLWVNGDYFRVLGVAALRGRVFTAEDDRHGGGSAGPVAVISYGFWKRNFGGDANVVGKTVRLNRHKFEIVGVTPPWFTGLDVDRPFDVAIPLGCEPILHSDRSWLNARSAWWLQILGRIRAGETIEQAQARMSAIGPEIFRATLPADYEPRDQKEYLKSSITLKPAAVGFSRTGQEYRKALFTLMGIVGLVLLIASANIANLLFARASARQREFSVRMAIGARRRRVIRQLMTESLLLSILGAAGGFLLALWGSRLLVRMLSTQGNPLEIDVSPDPSVLGFTAAVTVLTAVLFGLAPALRATRIELNQALKESARNAVPGSTRFHLGKGLVAGQVALSLVLVVGAGMFLKTLGNLLAVDPGFDPRHILTINVDVQQAAIPKGERVRVFHEMLDRLRATPGVVSAASEDLSPISGQGWNQWTYPEGYAAKSREDTLTYFNRVSPGYFKTMKTPLFAGRDFNEHDDLNAPLAIIVGESTARHFFGRANPIGKTIGLDRMGEPGGAKDVYEIVGVVRDAKYFAIGEETLRTAYLASGQEKDQGAGICFTLRTSGPVEAAIPSAREAILSVHRGVSLEFGNFERQVKESLLQQRIVALLAAVFGSLALALAMVGLYGVTNYAVARRRNEIGIRIALGAGRRRVIWLIMRDVVTLLAVGVPVGLAVSLGAGRLIASLLYGVRPNDPWQLAGAAILLAAATAVAAYLPARRAARLDPMAALREE